MKHQIRIENRGSELNILGLPKNYTIEVLAIDSNKKFYLVDRPESLEEGDKSGYDTFCLFIGQGNDMVQAEIINILKIRDELPTDINFYLNGRVGKFHLPSIYKKENPKITYADGEIITSRLLYPTFSLSEEFPRIRT